jgi:hypothetical protein
VSRTLLPVGEVSDPDRVNVARRMDTRSVRFATLAMTVLALSVALPSSASAKPNWLVKARILVASNPANHNCRTGVCQHNENTDLTRWHGAIYLVHRPDALLRRPYVVGAQSALSDGGSGGWSSTTACTTRRHMKTAI